MVISLYAVRVVLKELGFIDYGIYNVVGSIVALCSFLTGSLTAASNRFFSREILKEDKSFLNKIFCLNITFFGFLIICSIVLLETVGLWYVNTKMMIPENRLFASNVVYQLSIFTLASTFISIPYNALIITHERMSFYAYIGIIEAISRLGIALLLIISPFDKLITYAILMTILSVFITICYYVYCRRFYEESKYRFYWNREEFSEVIKFISLYFFGAISAVFRIQGMNILINMFFSPAINASRAIATQVEGVSKRFSDGYFTAAKPQIYKSYVNKEYNGLNLLINRITLICMFLMMVIVIPVSFNAEYVLSCWLGEVPDKAVIFVQLILIDAALNVTSEPIILTILATGKQGKYQLSEFVLRCVTLPIAYVFLLRGAEPESTVVVCILLSICSVITRIYFLKRNMPQFKAYYYIVNLLKLALAIAIVIGITYLLIYTGLTGLSYLFTTTILSIGMMLPTFYFIALSSHDKKYISNMLNAYIQKIK